jgi:protein-L-isoaspartate(D-aspartate) O-methyltransferase
MTPKSDYRVEREQLLREIDREMTATAGYTGRERLSPAVRAALARVPREAFVPEGMEELAYANHPLSIGHGQTISQPYIVALMTEVLDLGPEDTVLEVGTGSGYQCAVLAELARAVYSVETIPELAGTAGERLARLGYRNVHTHCGDGALGWPEHAPYDAIIVTAAARAVPPALVEQLAPGGRMVIPVGVSWLGQDLVLLTKDTDGGVHSRDLLAVAFVPLVTSDRNLGGE